MDRRRMLIAFLATLGVGAAALAVVRIVLDRQAASTPAPAAAPATMPAPGSPPSRPATAPAGPAAIELDLGGGVTMRLVRIPAGSFRMGSPAEEAGRDDDETPHRVTISRPFYLGCTEVSQAQYRAVTGANPAHFHNDGERPVEFVSFTDAVAFCRKLSQRTGCVCRLPTEAQWEYAARAGSMTAFCFGDSLPPDAANFDDTSPDGTVTHQAMLRGTDPVGTNPANAWGVHDMHGNLWEWCADWYADYPPGDATDPAGPAAGESRVLRGGSWHQPSRLARSANRYWHREDLRHYNVGFRVAVEKRDRE